MGYLEFEQQVRPLTGPLVRLLPPKPSSRPLPSLVLRSSDESPFGVEHPNWRCETFVVPAAFPRSVKGSTAHPVPAEHDVGGAPQRIDLDKALLDLFEPQSEALKSEINPDNPAEYEDQEQLYLAVNRYRSSAPRRSGEGGPGLTLVFSHANGFHKEIWEPAMADLLGALDTPGAAKTRPIEEMWALDCVLQGDSAILNEPVIGHTFAWADHGRDLTNFLLSYIDSPLISSSPFTLHPTLDPVSSLDPALFHLDAPPHPAGPSVPALRLWRNKLIVGIGHSVGGAGTAYAATAIPSLFSSIVLCDPVLPPTSHVLTTAGLTGGALVRKDRWGSRIEASEGFLKKAFFRNWDPRVLKMYVEYGLKSTAQGVQLKTRAKDEALVFGDPMASSSRRAYARLHTLPSALPVHFIFAEEGRSVLQESYIKDLLAQVPHATSSRVAGAGHLIAQERPRETAEEMAAFLSKTYPLEGRYKL